VLRILVALVAVVVLVSMPAVAQQKGVLAPGASVEVDTDADSFSSFSFWHDAKKSVAVEIVGPTNKQLVVEPEQRVGYAGKYGGKKVKLLNKSDVPLNYSVD